MTSRGAFWTTLVLGALTACADLEPIAKGDCGNGVVDPGEDCDTFGRLDMICRPAEAEGACRFDCSEANTCSPGYRCGQDSICRTASGRFELKSMISDPANFIVPADFDGNGETDLLASGDFGLVLSYQGGDFEEEDTVDLTFASELALVAGGHLTNDEVADIAFVDYFDPALGVVRGSEDRTFEGTVYPALAIPSAQAQIFALDGDPTMAGEEPMIVIDLPSTQTVVLRASISSSAEPDYFMSDPGALPALKPGSLAPVRSGRLDPTKPCEQYVLVFREQAFVGTPCLDDGSVNGHYTLDGEPPAEVVPIPLQPIDLGQCDIELGRGFVLDVDADQDLDVVLTPRAPLGAGPCVLRGPLALVEAMSASLVAESYPLFTLGPSSTGEEGDLEQILDLSHLNGDSTPDLVTSVSIFTSQTGPCPLNLTQHAGDGGIVHCSTSEDDFFEPATYVSAAIGNVNGDGVRDVALAARDAEQVLVHIGYGDGTFAVHAVEAEGSPEQLVLGDVDADGLDDLIFADKVCDADGFCVDPEDPSDILTVAFGRVSGGLEDPRSLGRVPSIESLGKARFASPFFGIDSSVDVGVLARDPADQKLSFAIMNGDTRRELQAAFYLSTPGETPEEGVITANPTRLALGHFVERADDAFVPAFTEDGHRDIAVVAFDGFGIGVGEGEPTQGPGLRLWLLDSEGEAKLSTSQAWPSGDDIFYREQDLLLGALAAADLGGDAADEIVYAGGVGLAIGTVVLDVNDAHPFFALEQMETGLTVRSTVLFSRELLLPALETSNIGAVPVPLQLGDLDGDGQREIVLSGETAAGGAQLLVLWNDGGYFGLANSSTLDLPLETSAYLLLSVDDDAELEVLVAADGSLVAYDVFDRQLTELDLAIDLGEPDISVIESADFDRDGVADLVLGHAESMTLYRGLPGNERDD